MNRPSPPTSQTVLPAIPGSDSDHVIMEVTADWCGNGHLFSPIVRRALSRFDNGLLHLVVDIDRHPKIRRIFRIHTLPTLLVLRNGVLVDSVIGAAPEEELVHRIGESLGLAPHPPTTTTGG